MLSAAAGAATGAAAGSVRSAGAGDTAGATGAAFSAAWATRAVKTKTIKAGNPNVHEPRQRLNFRLRVNGDTFGNDDSRRETVRGGK